MTISHGGRGGHMSNWSGCGDTNVENVLTAYLVGGVKC